LTFFFALGGLLFVTGVAARYAIARVAAASTVDQYYWLLAARAYREQRSLPTRIPGKYLMEDETQGYPPLFGMLLGHLPTQSLVLMLTPALEVLEFVVLAAMLHVLGAQLDMLMLVGPSRMTN